MTCRVRMIDIRDGTCTLCQPPEISESRPKLIEYQYEAVHPERWQPAALTHELDPTCGVDLLPRKPVGKKIRVAQTSRATPPPRRHPRWPLTAKPETRAVLRESGWHGSRKQARMAAKKTAAKKTAAKKTTTKKAAAKNAPAKKTPAKKKTAAKKSLRPRRTRS